MAGASSDGCSMDQRRDGHGGGSDTARNLKKKRGKPWFGMNMLRIHIKNAGLEGSLVRRGLHHLLLQMCKRRLSPLRVVAMCHGCLGARTLCNTTTSLSQGLLLMQELPSSKSCVLANPKVAVVWATPAVTVKASRFCMPLTCTHTHSWWPYWLPLECY